MWTGCLFLLILEILDLYNLLFYKQDRNLCRTYLQFIFVFQQVKAFSLLGWKIRNESRNWLLSTLTLSHSQSSVSRSTGLSCNEIRDKVRIIYKTLIAKKDNPSFNKIWINAPGYQITLQIQCDFLQFLFNLKQDNSNFN